MTIFGLLKMQSEYMLKKLRMLAFLLLLSGAVIAVPAFTTTARAQFTGTVCVIASGSTACPSSPPTITGTVGTQLRVSVFIQGSDGLNGFDITLLASHLILQPAGIDLTGTVLQGPQQVLSECLGTVQQVSGGPPCPANSTADTLELAALNCIGCGLTAAPTTGLLFTAIYNVAGSTSGTPLGYQTGCAGSTSVPNTCITIANGTPTPDPENALAATFTTGTVPPDFTISASPTTLTFAKSSQGTSTISLTSVNGFTGTVSLSVTVAPSRHAPSASLSPPSVSLSGGTGSSTLTVSASKHTAVGTYTVTITGTSGTISHTVTVTVTIT